MAGGWQLMTSANYLDVVLIDTKICFYVEPDLYPYI